MKLLLDENLSDRIVAQVLDLFPDSTHVKPQGLTHADDVEVWNFARERGFAIVSKDADFHQRSLVFGHPPKVIFLRVGNGPTARVTELLRASAEQIAAFEADDSASVLVLS